MSKYQLSDTNMSDGACIKQALCQMGFDEAHIEVHAEPQTLFGYHGDARPERANIIIRRQHTGIGASNDIGFLKDPVTGTYRGIISQYDAGAKFNDSWLGKLRQGYAEIRTIAQAKAKGHRLLTREIVRSADGREAVKLRFVAR